MGAWGDLDARELKIKQVPVIGHGTGVILFPWDWREGIFRRHENRMGNKNPVDGDFREQIYKIYKFTNLQKLHESMPPYQQGYCHAGCTPRSKVAHLPIHSIEGGFANIATRTKTHLSYFVKMSE